MCEVSAVPKIGHKIESMEFLESLGKLKRFLSIHRIFILSTLRALVGKNRPKSKPKLC